MHVFIHLYEERFTRLLTFLEEGIIRENKPPINYFYIFLYCLKFYNKHAYFYDLKIGLMKPSIVKNNIRIICVCVVYAYWFLSLCHISNSTWSRIPKSFYQGVLCSNANSVRMFLLVFLAKILNVHSHSFFPPTLIFFPC